MSLETFRNTRREESDLHAALADEMFLPGARGLTYCNGALFIEDTTAWPIDAPGYGQGRWYTLIGRSEYQSDDLESIEAVLYEFARSEEYCS